MYRRCKSNRELSGLYAEFCGKPVIWENNVAPAHPESPWVPSAGKVVRVARDGSAYFVRERGTLRWIDEVGGWQRNIKIG